MVEENFGPGNVIYSAAISLDSTATHYEGPWIPVAHVPDRIRVIVRAGHDADLVIYEAASEPGDHRIGRRHPITLVDDPELGTNYQGFVEFGVTSHLIQFAVLDSTGGNGFQYTVRGCEMAWTGSEIFCAFITDALNNTTDVDLNANDIKVALFNNDITPDQTAVSANAAYNAGVWTTGDEVTSGGWSAGGLVLQTVSSAFSSNVYKFDAADTANSTAATLSGVRGCLVYDSEATTVADQAISFHTFGTDQSVTSGTLTIVWNTDGIFTLTL